MERHNGHYLTIWYGIYERSSNILTYAGAGHPPALLLSGAAPPTRLWSRSRPVGMFKDTVFRSTRQPIAASDQLLIYSDGVFEFTRPDGERSDLEEFVGTCCDVAKDEKWDLDDLVSKRRSVTGAISFEDDCSLITLHFRDTN